MCESRGLRGFGFGALASAFLLLACDPGSASSTPAPGSVPAAHPQTVGGDVVDVVVAVPGETVLVWKAGAPFILAAEYNGWVRSWPGRFEGLDASAGRRSALRRMVRYQLILERAREERLPERIREAGETPTDTIVVNRFYKERAGNTQRVSDTAARAYLASHQDTMAELAPEGTPEQILLMAAKLKILDDAFTVELQGWIAAAALTYNDDVL